IGCALGGSQQEDAKILLEHHRAMGGGNGKATAFVSGFKTDPVDAAFLNGHMIRAMDYNDIYWRADPCHPSDLIAAPLALCESEGLSGKDLILGTIIAYEIEMRLCEIGRPGIREYGWHHATLSAFAAPVAAGRVLTLTREQMVSAIGISAARTFCPGAVTAGKLTNIKNKVDADDVKEIKVEVIARAADILSDPHKYRPDSKGTADHSLPYCMAVGLVDGMVTPLQFREERVLDQSLIPIVDKVKVVAND